MASLQINKTDNTRIVAEKELIAPLQVMCELPCSSEASQLVNSSRNDIHNILSGNDKRLIVVVGPCSIHSHALALEYAQRLIPLYKSLGNELKIVMRVYFEKPRTIVGWKGLINDPNIDGSFKINEGLVLARKILLDLATLGLPTASEFLDVISPQYIADLISWGAIGARTTESQLHRELASGMSCPIGFKNGTDGSITTAMDAIKAASHPHHFLSTTKAGHSAIFETAGNPDCHIILRGGTKGTNYDAASISACYEAMKMRELSPQVMVDASHGNSSKQFKKQIEVSDSIAQQITAGDEGIIGVMIESHINEGRQDVTPATKLKHGVSITDACLGWEDTAHVLENLANAVAKRNANRNITNR